MPRRLAMLASDAIRCLAVGAVAALVATGHANLAALILMSVVFGIADAFFFPASTAITPELVPTDLLVGASSLNSTSTQLAQILVGPAIGGLIVSALGPAWGFGLNAGSFAVSAACLLAMKSRARPAARRDSVLRDIANGLVYIRSQRWLWVSLIGVGLGNFAAFSPLGVLIPLLVERTLHRGGLAFGLVLGAGGLGGLGVSLLLGHFGAPRRRITFLWLGWGLSGVGVLGLGLSPGIWVVAVLMFVTYALDACGSVLWNPLLQDVIPADMLGRAASIDYLVSFALSPLGLVAAGAVAARIGTRPTLIIGGGVTALTTFIPLIPGVRNVDTHLS